MNNKDFLDFEEGYYKYKGDLVYISKTPKQLILKDLNTSRTIEGSTIGGLIIYSCERKVKEKINFSDLIETDSFDYLKKKNIQIIEFIQAIEKEKEKRLEQIAQS